MFLAQLRATLTETKREKTEAATALSKLQHERDVHAWTASSEMEQAVMAAETRAREAVAEQERLQHTVTDTERAAEAAAARHATESTETRAAMEAEKRELMASAMSAETRAAAHQAALETGAATHERVGMWQCRKIWAQRSMQRTWRRWGGFAAQCSERKRALRGLLVGGGIRARALRRAWHALGTNVWRRRTRTLQQGVARALHRERCLEVVTTAAFPSSSSSSSSSSSCGLAARACKAASLLTWKVYTGRRATLRHALSQCLRYCRLVTAASAFARLAKRTHANTRALVGTQHAEEMLRRRHRRTLRFVLFTWHKNARVDAALRHWWERASAAARSVGATEEEEQSSSPAEQRFGRSGTAHISGTYGRWIDQNHLQRWFSRWVMWALVRRRADRLRLHQAATLLEHRITTARARAQRQRLHHWRRWGISRAPLAKLVLQHGSRARARALRRRWNKWRGVSTILSHRRNAVWRLARKKTRVLLDAAWAQWRRVDKVVDRLDDVLAAKRALLEGLIGNIVERVTARAMRQQRLCTLASTWSAWWRKTAGRQHARQIIKTLSRIGTKQKRQAAREGLGLYWRRWCRTDLEGRVEAACAGLQELLNNERSHLATSRGKCRALSQKLATTRRELSTTNARVEQVSRNTRNEISDPASIKR